MLSGFMFHIPPSLFQDLPNYFEKDSGGFCPLPFTSNVTLIPGRMNEKLCQAKGNLTTLLYCVSNSSAPAQLSAGVFFLCCSSSCLSFKCSILFALMKQKFKGVQSFQPEITLNSSWQLLLYWKQCIIQLLLHIGFIGHIKFKYKSLSLWAVILVFHSSRIKHEK